MKKRINPILFRNSIYNNFLEYSNNISNKNTKALILFQDEEIKKNIIKYLRKFRLIVLNLYVARSNNNLNIDISFLKKKYLHSLTEKKKRFISRLNFLKFNILNKILYKKEDNKRKILKHYIETIKKFKQKKKFLKLSKLRSKIRKFKNININTNYVNYINLKLLKYKLMSLTKLKSSNLKKKYIKKLNYIKYSQLQRVRLIRKNSISKIFFRQFSNVTINNRLQINPFNNFYNKYKSYSILPSKNYFKLKFNQNLKFKNILNKNVLIDAIKFYNIKKLNIFIKEKLLNIIHKYTGYSSINIIFKNILLTKRLKLEMKYNNLFKYTQMFIKYISKYNINILKVKYLQKKLKKKNKNFKIKVNFNKFFKKRKSKKYDLFLRKFPYYLVRQYKFFLSRIFYYFVLKNYDIQSKFLILQKSFKYIYKRFHGHFFRAFKFYKSLISKLFRYNFLKVTGVKIIFKGRFGKVRKQISKLNFGSLSLNTVLQKVIYFNSIILTKRGSYGFHMWFAIKSKK